MFKKSLAVVAPLFFLMGCATIVSDSSKNLYLSNANLPENTKVLIESKGSTYLVNVPGNVVLPNTCQGADVYLADTHEPIQHIPSEVNGWILGNILFGGVIGLTVDGLTGNMCKIGNNYMAL